MRAYDALVVGAGAAGGWAAKELCEAGLEVLLLDAGRAIDPGTDFPLPAPPRRPLASRVAAAARGQRVQLRCAAFDARTARFFVNDRESPYTTPAGQPFNWFRGRQVGGRLHVWARVALRLSDRELAGWPLGYDELAPYYDEVERFMGVAAVAPTAAERCFAQAVDGRARVEPVRLAGREPAARVPRTIRAAEATGRLTLRPDAVVRRVLLDPRTRRATGVELVDRRSRSVVEARGRLVVLCASTVETLRILLGSGVEDRSRRLGRGLMDHVMTGVGGPLPPGNRAAPPGDPYDVGSGTGFVIPRSGYGVQGGIGREARSWYMLAHGEMSARPESRVTLSEQATDAWGVPAAHIACAPSAREAAVAEEGLAAMRELAAAAGLRVRTPPSGGAAAQLAFRLARRSLLGRGGAFVPGSAAAEVGGAAMGDDPSESVTDGWGRVWGADNLVVADGAVFPAGCWQNVTLTIMAHAVRACRRAARDLLGA